MFWGAVALGSMSRSKYSPQQGKENKTVPGEEEQSSQTSSWWLLVLIALCTVTTIVDKRRRHPSTAPTELQDKQTKRGQIESSASDNGQGRNKWNPQTWGNFSLVLIQGALFSLFQIVGPSGSWEDKEGGRLLLSSDSAGGVCNFLLYHHNERVWGCYNRYDVPAPYSFRNLLKPAKSSDWMDHFLPDFHPSGRVEGFRKSQRAKSKVD